MIHRDAAIGVMQSKNQVTELEGPGGIAVDEHDRLAPALVDVMHGLAVCGFQTSDSERGTFRSRPSPAARQAGRFFAGSWRCSYGILLGYVEVRQYRNHARNSSMPRKRTLPVLRRN